MPRVWEGRRRILLLTLFLIGVVQAILALVMSFSVDGLLQSAQRAGVDPAALIRSEWPRLLALTGSVLGIGVARWQERVVAEDLGQDYVFEQRARLLTTALADERRSASLGVIVTRASNDLTSVRNWLALGIVPLITAVPLILIVLAVLAWRNWPVVLAVALPILMMVVVLPALASVAHSRARALRRRRGRMSARIADSVQAGESVRAAGAVQRELNALNRDSTRVVDAAVDRAVVTGAIRALTVTVGSLATVAVVTLALLGLVDAAGVASTMTLLGVMAGPLADLGKVVEYRQNYKAARRILAPLLADAEELKEKERQRELRYRRDDRHREDPAAGLQIGHLVVDGRQIPDLQAAPGDRVHLCSADPEQVRRAVHAVMLGRSTSPFDTELPEPEIRVSGLEPRRTPAGKRRTLIGFASTMTPLERGSIRRLVSLRIPDATDEEIWEVLEKVGLRGKVAAGERGPAQKLKNGGSGWDPGELLRLRLARALLRCPALLVIEGADTVLDAEGVRMLRGIIADHPGVVLFTAAAPEHLGSRFQSWNLDGPRILPESFRAGRGSIDEEEDE